MTVALRLRVAGVVQGVGFRAWTVRQARRLGLSGWVRNRADGSVEILAAGAAEALEAFCALCHRGPPGARVDSVVRDVAPPPAGAGFAQAPTE